MIPPERIKHFVQHTLGCSCPEEVFRSIDVREQVALNSCVFLDCALIIGNRLLIYVVEAGTEGCIEEHLPVLVNAGRNERDEKGLNRFRLVLVTNYTEGVRQVVERQFEELRDNDEKVHLQVIKKSESPLTVEDTEEKPTVRG
jgi:hypothetical protein